MVEKDNKEQEAEVERLCIELLPDVVCKTMKSMRKPYTPPRGIKTLPEIAESLEKPLEQELLSQAILMLNKQYPNVNEGIIRKYMPDRLREWYYDNRQSLTKVKASANRKREGRMREYLIANRTHHDPRERPNELPKRIQAEYLKQEEPEELEQLGTQCPNNHRADVQLSDGSWTSEFDYNYSVAEEDIKRMTEFLNYLFIFVAEDDTDRDIIAYMRSQFDPSDPMILLELEKISHKRIAKEVEVGESTVSRRLAAMKKRIRHVDGARRKGSNHPCGEDTKAA